MLERLPPAASTYASAIDDHVRLIYWITGVFFVVAQVAIFYALVRFRRSGGVRAAWLPADTWRSNAWVLIPAALVLVLDLVIEVDSARVWAQVKEDIPVRPDVLLRVTGRQFSWSFTYAGRDGKLDTQDDVATVELHVPKGRTVRFQLESEDVVHALYVPALRLKQDAVPGRSIPGWFEAIEEGTHEIVCAELCGPVHGYMRSTLVVESPEAFARWLAEQGAGQ